MDKQWMRAPRSTTEYAAGVTKFLEFAAENAGMVHIVLCPCKTCANRFWNNRTLVSEHMYKCHLTISKFVHIPCLNISMVTRPCSFTQNRGLYASVNLLSTADGGGG
ncbi:hypothetical protein QYE76_051237 [Lolium multiflorum]|uniref:Transposase-associated domain-containing protein n=1 Tax=Lolium multiflorum TaxID=4521 RepID=A0AAD8STC2_LOLMU|nr:hypothetical protein QYE76_064488 [Lolium multiflorum]KAK1663078.1 hypothetical protein QYE76_051237 [Lolium multiflorum]